MVLVLLRLKICRDDSVVRRGIRSWPRVPPRSAAHVPPRERCHPPRWFPRRQVMMPDRVHSPDSALPPEEFAAPPCCHWSRSTPVTPPATETAGRFRRRPRGRG